MNISEENAEIMSRNTKCLSSTTLKTGMLRLRNQSGGCTWSGGVPGPGGCTWWGCTRSAVGGVPGLGVYLVQGDVPGGGVPGRRWGMYLVLGGVPGPEGVPGPRGRSTPPV